LRGEGQPIFENASEERMTRDREPGKKLRGGKREREMQRKAEKNGERAEKE